jgi:hypothetical protein
MKWSWMMTNFTQEQYKLIFNSVRRYQIEKCILNSEEYNECDVILTELFDYAYTQLQEQPT